MYSNKLNGLELAVRDIRLYWGEHEEPLYDTGINPTTGKYYIPVAKRDFTKHHMENIAGFYIMRDKLPKGRQDGNI